jgi:hypothetical protein
MHILIKVCIFPEKSPIIIPDLENKIKYQR